MTGRPAKVALRCALISARILADEIRRPGTFSYYWVLAVQEGGVPGLVALLIALAGLYVFYDGHVKKMKRGGSKKRR